MLSNAIRANATNIFLFIDGFNININALYLIYTYISCITDAVIVANKHIIANTANDLSLF
jgi:hypothetical protein